MALTKIQAGSFEAGAISTADLSANTTAAFAVSLSPKITTVNVANSSYTVLDDTAVNVFKNGILDATSSSSANIKDTTASFHIGWGQMWDAYGNFHIDDLRITKGVARYTSNFTPPTTEHPVQ